MLFRHRFQVVLEGMMHRRSCNLRECACLSQAENLLTYCDHRTCDYDAQTIIQIENRSKNLFLVG